MQYQGNPLKYMFLIPIHQPPSRQNQNQGKIGIILWGKISGGNDL